MWVLDSGCSNHMTGEKEMFSTLERDNLPSGGISFGNDGEGKVIGRGRIAITHDLSINNVFHVQGLGYNLMSVSQLCAMGYYCLFTDESVIVLRKCDLSIAF